MRCKTCEYRLWNLPARRCPECGTPFKPSDYDFTINSVQFRCPHCDQSYYGTGEHGHLVPMEFDCVGCGRHIHMDEMVLSPTAGVEENQTRIENAPWLERAQRGRVRAWLSTVGMALTRPARLMEMLPEEGATGQAVLFGVITTLLLVPLALSPFFLLPLVFLVSGLGRVGLGEVAALVLADIVATAVTLASMLVWGLTIHGLLRITGETAGGLGRTYQAVFYGSGANVGSALPCMGIYVGWIWCVISTVLMVKSRQRVSGLRAAFATVAFPVSFLAGIIGLYVWFFLSVIPGIPTTGPAVGFPFAATMPVGQLSRTVLDAVLIYAGDHDSMGPDHAAELVACGYLHASDLIIPGSQTKADQIQIGETTLTGLESLRREPAQKEATAAAAKLPANTVAHRLGDWVFTYHRITLNPPPDGQLWLVVQCLDPDANPQHASTDILVWQADGTSLHFSDSSFTMMLRKQNFLRQGLGFPSLPDPRQVTHSRPAVADDARKR
ncbi:MAG: MJ0042-type zinc finger domain-containing protein [Phycisphaerae bacterium]